MDPVFRGGGRGGGKPSKFFCKQLGKLSELIALVLMVDFNFPATNSKYYTAVTSRSWKCLMCVGGNFLSQVLSQVGRMPP